MLPHEYLECNSHAWNDWAALELGRLIDFLDARAVVFSGVFPYAAVIRAAGQRMNCPLSWIRIPLWKKPLWKTSTDRGSYFDAVIDTGEVAEARSVAATLALRDRVHLVPPVILPEESDLLERDEARRALGLDPDRPAVLLQLGAGNNLELESVVDHILATLKAHGDFQVVIAEWLIADRALDAWPHIKRLRYFPNARFIRAFDFAMTACGYGTFHEAIAFGVPTIFVPNENMGTDDQLARGQFAAEEGLGMCLRVNELDRFADMVPEIMDADVRARFAEVCREHFTWGGAAAAARLITDLT